MHSFTIGGTLLSNNTPPYLVAELSGNHNQSIDRAKTLIEAAAKAGAHAVKLQAYTPDTLSLNCKKDRFLIKEGPWAGQYQYTLYQQAMTPWEWIPELADHARKYNLELFCSPFDESSVDFLQETLNPSVYKIASLEITHLPLLKKVAQTGKPVLLSTGNAEEQEIKQALECLNENGCHSVLLLKCINAYPAQAKDFNLRSLIRLQENFPCPVGLSDHSLSNEVSLGAIALGACLIEKHLTLSRTEGGVDSAFSLEPQEFHSMAKSINILYESLGESRISPSDQELIERRFRRSIYVSSSIKEGDTLSIDNLKIIRQDDGLPPSEWENVLGKAASRTLSFGEPLSTGDFH
tara:strand:- start:77350 stop:78399 length:1050 start_codon:yes stop_codon:yes gene_type:complete